MLTSGSAVNTNRCRVCSQSNFPAPTPAHLFINALISSTHTHAPKKVVHGQVMYGQHSLASRLQPPQAQPPGSNASQPSPSGKQPAAADQQIKDVKSRRQDVLAAFGVGRSPAGSAQGVEPGMQAGDLGHTKAGPEIEDFTWQPGEMDQMEPEELLEAGDLGPEEAVGRYSTAGLLGLGPRSSLPEVQVRAHSHSHARRCIRRALARAHGHIHMPAWVHTTQSW